ncbi:hypothetical protein B0H17DRAFT_1195770 [Mycena rosella]|uniref:PPM-type phosphatase domain-containing protein n=1 Tax=Mycena rosella TaxID=1033263 RepID=A0AAD7DXN0_MYCRO|nr:hypothetical protein B0H17DRAFT_1195770 [Mycena rosella]
MPTAPEDNRSRLSEASSARVIYRYFVEDWALPIGQWKILAIFDSHGAGPEAVDFVLNTLSSEIKSALSILSDEDISDARLDDLLTQCIRDVDMCIQTDFLALFPREIHDHSQEEISCAVRDPDLNAGHSRVEVLQMQTGTTAINIVALVDPNVARLPRDPWD